MNLITRYKPNTKHSLKQEKKLCRASAECEVNQSPNNKLQAIDNF